MNSLLAAIAILAAIVVVAVALGALVQWVQSDGSPRSRPMARPEADWSPDLPTRPYSSL